MVEAPLPKDAPTDEDAILVLRATPLLTDEESQELFEANLPLAGLLPVRMEMVNKGSAPVEMERARFRLRDAEDDRVDTLRLQPQLSHEPVGVVLIGGEIEIGMQRKGGVGADERAHSLVSDINRSLGTGHVREAIVLPPCVTRDRHCNRWSKS